MRSTKPEICPAIPTCDARFIPFPFSPCLSDELMSLKEENQSMSCQIEAYKNEVEIMKTDQNKYSEEKETQIKALQHALVGMQQVCGIPQGIILGPCE